MNLFQVPYPKVSFKMFVRVILLIGISVIFILTVFQPFGTARFKHEYKYLILSGYGFVIFSVGILYYWVTNFLIPQKVKDKWSIVHEVVYLFFNVMVCLIACYMYYGIVFDSKMNFTRFFDFLLHAGSVAILPVAGYLLFIYLQYKEVSHFDTKGALTSNENDLSSKVKLTGSNKNEKLEIKIDDLLFVKSNDNYVIIYLLENGKLSKKMLRNTLNKIDALAGEQLVKCHRSYLVNTSKIINIEGNITNSQLSIQGLDQKIPVSRSYVEMFRKMLTSA